MSLDSSLAREFLATSRHWKATYQQVLPWLTRRGGVWPPAVFDCRGLLHGLLCALFASSKTETSVADADATYDPPSQRLRAFLEDNSAPVDVAAVTECEDTYLWPHEELLHGEIDRIWASILKLYVPQLLIVPRENLPPAVRLAVLGDLGSRDSGVAESFSGGVPVWAREHAWLWLSGGLAGARRSAAADSLTYYALLQRLGYCWSSDGLLLSPPSHGVEDGDSESGQNCGRLPQDLLHLIDLDVKRTYFGGYSRSAIRRLLRAYALRNPGLGYCQGMSYIAGVLVCSTVCEEAAFCILCAMVEDGLLPPDYFTPSLGGASLDRFVVRTLIDVFGRSENQTEFAGWGGCSADDIAFVTMPWYMSLFSSVLPLPLTQLLWDLLFCFGECTVFRLIVALFVQSQKICAEDTGVLGRESLDMAIQRLSPPSLVSYCGPFHPVYSKISNQRIQDLRQKLRPDMEAEAPLANDADSYLVVQARSSIEIDESFLGVDRSKSVGGDQPPNRPKRQRDPDSPRVRARVLRREMGQLFGL